MLLSSVNIVQKGKVEFLIDHPCLIQLLKSYALWLSCSFFGQILKTYPYLAIFFLLPQIMTFTVCHCGPIWSFNEEQLKFFSDSVTIVKTLDSFVFRIQLQAQKFVSLTVAIVLCVCFSNHLNWYSVLVFVQYLTELCSVSYVS